MWKFILLLSTFVVAQAAVEDIFGTWSLTAYSPIQKEIEVKCGQMVFDKASGDSDCACDDGKEATLVSLAHAADPESTQNKIPLVAVDGPNTASQNVKCKCGLNDYPDRLTYRLINNNCFLLYVNPEKKTKELAPTTFVYSKVVPTASELDALIASIDDLKNVSVGKACIA